jgi:hypothetical protein
MTHLFAHDVFQFERGVRHEVYVSPSYNAKQLASHATIFGYRYPTVPVLRFDVLKMRQKVLNM